MEYEAEVIKGSVGGDRMNTLIVSIIVINSMIIFFGVMFLIAKKQLKPKQSKNTREVIKKLKKLGYF